MYDIEKKHNHLRVNFSEDFDYETIKRVIHHLTMIREYPHTNDLWIIGKHHAHIRLSELETMVKEFHCRCPKDATRTKTAVVAERSMTRSVLELWVNAVKKRVNFDLEVFHSLEEAESWLGVSSCQLV
ncbi:MAG TPA: hypothetical protein VIR63_07180 [Pontiella sp.]